MFSAIRKINLNQITNPLKNGTVINPGKPEGFLATKFISTSDGAQNSEHMTKREKLGPADLNRLQKYKKTIRTLSTLNFSVPLAARTAVSKDESREFMSVFPDLVRDLTEYANKFGSQTITKRFAKALQYNVPNGKKNRGLITVLTYKQLVDKSELTAENLRLAQYLGWCVEMLQSVLLICDDIMDGSQTRRGHPCWYKLDEVGLGGINDALMVENGIYHILKKHFSNQHYYTNICELFHEIIFLTTLGQSLDLQTANENPNYFTMDKYKSIVTNKTSYYSFYLPVALAMSMADFTDEEAFRQARTILLEMGDFFQVQDDFIDCFGDPAVTGKIGTDIEENKCTWLSVVCMQRASDEQKEIMLECYGKKDPAKVARIKELYKVLGLPSTYAVYEEETYNMIKTHIQQSSRVPHEIFYKILEKIYQRVS